MSHGFVPALPIRHHAWKLRNLRNPTAVVLTLDLDLEVHGRNQSNAGTCCRLTDCAQAAVATLNGSQMQVSIDDGRRQLQARVRRRVHFAGSESAYFAATWTHLLSCASVFRPACSTSIQPFIGRPVRSQRRVSA